MSAESPEESWEGCPNAAWLTEFGQGNEEDRRMAEHHHVPLTAEKATRRAVAAAALHKMCPAFPVCSLEPDQACQLEAATLYFAAEIGFELGGLPEL